MSAGELYTSRMPFSYAIGSILLNSLAYSGSITFMSFTTNSSPSSSSETSRKSSPRPGVSSRTMSCTDSSAGKRLRASSKRLHCSCNWSRTSMLPWVGGPNVTNCIENCLSVGGAVSRMSRLRVRKSA
ncbi:hypothetical protein OH76DRAFT_887428 [Lentinus brumalis]|uniref:Uncharacterized protein n=1 Tax=Lentinus brumalis TaxID=2498619 RepID=A0A371D1D6_9APHY|nr:hypothetical protein OH76DRAFT_887428 [Polyporus brumalis]